MRKVKFSTTIILGILGIGKVKYYIIFINIIKLISMYQTVYSYTSNAFLLREQLDVGLLDYSFEQITS